MAKCQHCNSDFNPPQRELNRGNGKFCSRKCGNKGKRHPLTGHRSSLLCALCAKPFVRLTSNLYKSKSKLRFCSRKCKDIAQRLGGIKEIQPPHYGIANGEYSYRDVAFRHYPKKCNRCGYDKYPSILRVHHIDRNRQNNHPSNLEVLCPNCHEEDHFLAGDGLYSKRMVEKVGFAPTTSCLQGRRSPD